MCPLSLTPFGNLIVAYPYIQPDIIESVIAIFIMAFITTTTTDDECVFLFSNKFLIPANGLSSISLSQLF